MELLPTLSPLIDLALFVVTVAWVGKRPTAQKVGAMVVIVALVEIGVDSLFALSQGTSIYGWYLQGLDKSIEYYSSMLTADQLEMFAAVEQTIAGCWVGIYLTQAAVYVFFALFLVWLVGRLFKRPRDWAPFSQVDLPIWTVLVLIGGIVLYAVSNIPALPYRELVLLVSLNALIVAMVPLSVQGAAACKGVMNNLGLAAGWQVAIAVVVIVLGVALVVVPVVGLVDYWANLRKLPRGDEQE